MIAKVVPSGTHPHNLMAMMRNPTPIPNIHLPWSDFGDETGSVAMKNAPKIALPENK